MKVYFHYLVFNIRIMEIGVSDERFKQLLLRFSDKISKNDFEKLKFLYIDQISRTQLDSMASPIELIKELYHRGLISNGDIEKLKELIDVCTTNNPALLECIHSYELAKKEKQSQSPQSISLTQHLKAEIELLCESLNTSWNVFFQKLGYPNSKRFSQMNQNPRNIGAVIRNCLEDWLSKQKGKTVQEIKGIWKNVLKKINLVDLASKL